MEEKQVYNKKYFISLLVYVITIIVLCIIPSVGFIKVGLFTITTLVIPVLLASMRKGFLAAFVCGLTFGLCTYFYALSINVSGTFDEVFLNPIVAIVPRIIFALATVEIYKLVSMIVNKKWLCVAISSLFGCMINMFLIMLLSYFLEFDVLYSIYNERNFLYLIYF